MMPLDVPDLRVSILLDNSKQNLKVYVRNDSAQPVTLLDYPGRVNVSRVTKKIGSKLIVCFPSLPPKETRFTLAPGGNYAFNYPLKINDSGARNSKALAAYFVANYEDPSSRIGRRVYQSNLFYVNLAKWKSLASKEQADMGLAPGRSSFWEVKRLVR